MLPEDFHAVNCTHVFPLSELGGGRTVSALGENGRGITVEALPSFLWLCCGSICWAWLAARCGMLQNCRCTLQGGSVLGSSGFSQATREGGLVAVS